MRAIGILVVVLVMVSCASGPKQYTFSKQRTIPLAQDVVQARVLAWCGEKGFAVTSVTDGFVIAKSDLKVIENYSYDAWNGASIDTAVADCGKQGMVAYRADEGNLNVAIRGGGGAASMSDVTITFVPSTTAASQCVSTGRLERMLFEYIVSK